MRHSARPDSASRSGCRLAGEVISEIVAASARPRTARQHTRPPIRGRPDFPPPFGASRRPARTLLAHGKADGESACPARHRVPGGHETPGHHVRSGVLRPFHAPRRRVGATAARVRAGCPPRAPGPRVAAHWQTARHPTVAGGLGVRLF